MSTRAGAVLTSWQVVGRGAGWVIGLGAGGAIVSMDSMPAFWRIVIAGAALVASCGGKVQPDETSTGGGSAGVFAGGQPGGSVTAGSGVSGNGHGGSASNDPGTSTCMEGPSAWPGACPSNPMDTGISVAASGPSTTPDLLSRSCNCAGCAPGVTAADDECGGRWFLSFVGCPADAQHCATLRLAFQNRKVEAKPEYPVDDGGWVDTQGITWHLESGSVYDNIGSLGGPELYQPGHLLVFDVKAKAVDPDGKRESWPFVAHVGACVTSANGCLK